MRNSNSLQENVTKQYSYLVLHLEALRVRPFPHAISPAIDDAPPLLVQLLPQ